MISKFVSDNDIFSIEEKLQVLKDMENDIKKEDYNFRCKKGEQEREHHMVITVPVIKAIWNDGQIDYDEKVIMVKVKFVQDADIKCLIN